MLLKLERYGNWQLPGAQTRVTASDQSAARILVQHPVGKHLDADERCAAVSRGIDPRSRHYLAPGGMNITIGKWKLLAFIMVIAAGVRLYRLSIPNSVV